MSVLRIFFCGVLLMAFALLEGRHGAQASKILFLAPIAFKSHRQFYSSIVTTLAKQGHEMTFVSFMASKKTERVRDIVLPDLDLTPSMPNVFEGGTLAFLDQLIMLEDLCIDGLESPEVQQLFNEKFDLIMMPVVWSECFLVFHHHFKVPLVLVAFMGLVPPMDSWFGNPAFLSYDVNNYFGAEPPLSFGMRATNILYNLGLHAFTYIFNGRRFAKLSQTRGFLPADMPPFATLYQNASLLILNSHRAMETPKAYVPNVVHAGGLHINPTKPLPPDLEEWVQGAGDHGFIYFSLGSVVKTSYLPEKHLLTLMRVFGRLPQRVLMKWNEDHIEGRPPNVHLAKWLPQQDILAHPKVRLFISHGGIHSTMEALYHSVPILGMPIFSDQSYNLEKGSRRGWAIRLDWADLTEESLMSALGTALNDTKLRDTTSRMGAIIRDQPMSPAETVVYWVEYVLRHDGARHLRCPAADMNWFILYNFDIWITVFASVCLVVYAFLAMLRCCCRRCCHSKTKKKTD